MTWKMHPVPQGAAWVYQAVISTWSCIHVPMLELQLWCPLQDLVCAGTCVCVFVCVYMCQARVRHPSTQPLHCDRALSSHFQQGSSSWEALRKNWQEKFACWVYRACTLNVPRGFWEITHRINLVWFFLLAAFIWMLECACQPWTGQREITILAGNHIMCFTIRLFGFTVFTRNRSGKLWLNFIDLSISVPFILISQVKPFTLDWLFLYSYMFISEYNQIPLKPGNSITEKVKVLGSRSCSGNVEHLGTV